MKYKFSLKKSLLIIFCLTAFITFTFVKRKINNDKKLFNLLLKIPKIELHTHYHATLPVDFVEKHFHLKEKNIKLPKQYKDLTEFVNLYDKIFIFNEEQLSLKQIEEGAFEISQEAARHNIKHIEIKQSMIFGGKDELQIWKATADGLEKSRIELAKKGFIQTSGIQITLVKLKDAYKSEDLEQSLKNLKTAFLDKRYKIASIDVCGDEKLRTFNEDQQVQKLVKFAKKNGINITLHAGEVPKTDSFSPDEMIEQAIDLETMRIGHGVQIANNKDILNKIKKKQICLEICPLSNLKINNIKSFKDLKIKYLLDNNIKITINTDDKFLLDTNYTEQFFDLVKAGEITHWSDLKQIVMNGIDCAFLEKNEKDKIRKIIQNEFDAIEKDKDLSKVIKKNFN